MMKRYSWAVVCGDAIMIMSNLIAHKRLENCTPG